ncbi:histone deacetylase 6-like protein [Umbelopsis sp. PMI_123]|nr:histone deacetylase 6-like protein [Umbelopsis sp. PMI_123]
MNGESSSSKAGSSAVASESSNLLNVDLQEEMLGFAVTPKTDCDHLPHIQLVNDLDEAVVREAHCTHCGKPETWLCLTCNGVYCSRYQNNCAKLHAAEAQHPIALSLSDLSVWCYQCDEYITSPLVDNLKRRVYILKFNVSPPEASELDVAT